MGNSADSKPIKGREFSTYRYIGELNNQREPNGKGLILHNSGEAFYGFFSNGKKNGIGIYIDKKLTKYICKWVNDKAHRELKVKPFHAKKVFSFFYSNEVIESCKVYRVGPKPEHSLDAQPKRRTPKGGETHSAEIKNGLDRAHVSTVESGDKGCVSILPVSKPGSVCFLPRGRVQQGRTASREGGHHGSGRLQSGHREDAIESSRVDQLQVAMEKESHDEANIPVNERPKKIIDEELKKNGTWEDIFYTSSDSCSHFIRPPHFVKLGGKKKCYRDTYQCGTTRKDLTIITHTSTKKEQRKTKHMIKRLTKQNSSSLKIDKYESWSRKEVAQWLSLCNAPIKWITAFYRNNVTGSMLDTMNIEVIRNQLGILPYGHAIKLLQLIKNLRVMAYNKRFARCVNIQECEHFLRRKKKKNTHTIWLPRGNSKGKRQPQPK
ncbi:SAM domain-containing protein, partial [Plasmodium cynomolgi strain B]